MGRHIIESVVETDSAEECGGQLQATSTIRLRTSGGHEVEIGAWCLCGWIARGAHADLDGSGLRLWGDAQHGGWSCCDGDGAVSGRPSLARQKDVDADDDIEILGGEGQADVMLSAADFPSWLAACQTLNAAREATARAWAPYEAAAEGSDEETRLGAAHDAAEAAEDAARRACASIRDEILAEVEEIIGEADLGADEPDADDQWEALGESAEITPDVRAGLICGYPRIVVCADGECAAFGPGDSWERAVRDAAADSAEARVIEAIEG